jgi:hypothetical protein
VGPQATNGRRQAPADEADEADGADGAGTGGAERPFDSLRVAQGDREGERGGNGAKRLRNVKRRNRLFPYPSSSVTAQRGTHQSSLPWRISAWRASGNAVRISA